MRPNFGVVRTCTGDRLKIAGEPEQTNPVLTRESRYMPMLGGGFGMHQAVRVEYGKRPEKSGGRDTQDAGSGLEGYWLVRGACREEW